MNRIPARVRRYIIEVGLISSWLVGLYHGSFLSSLETWGLPIWARVTIALATALAIAGWLLSNAARWILELIDGEVW